jgi:hypothetical protein
MTTVAGPPSDARDAALDADADDQTELRPGTRRAIGALVTVVLTATLLAHTPDWLAGEDARPVGESVLHAMGIEMNWIVFAPNPPDRTTVIEGRITFEDGSTSTWHPPSQDPWIGTYSQYRWDKTAEFTSSRALDWAPEQLAQSIARRTEAETGRAVAQVEVVVRRKPIEAIGGDWVDEVLAVHRPEATP